MSKVNFTDTNAGYNLQVINANFDAVEQEFEKVLYRQNPTGEPNQMLNDLDMNGNRILNLPVPISLNEPARLQDLVDAINGSVEVPTTASQITVNPTGHLTDVNVQAALQTLSEGLYNETQTRASADTTLNTGITTNTAAINTKPVPVDSIASLRLVLHTVNTVAIVAGYYNRFGAGGGTYYYDSTDSTTADNGGTVIVASDGGRWKLKHAGEVTAEQFGAVGDGVTDDWPFLHAAVTAPGVYVVKLSAKPYRVSQTFVVPVGIHVYSKMFSAGAPSTTDPAAQIIGDLAVSPILKISNGGYTTSTAARAICVTRAAGTIPANSVGILITESANCTYVEDLLSTRSAYTYSVGGGTATSLGVHLLRCVSGQATQAHLLLSNVVESTMTECRFGRNGGADVYCVSYVEISGPTVDTVRFQACQFNQSGAYTGGVLRFTGYASNPNGIISLNQCHAEQWEGGVLIVLDSASTNVRRIRIANSSMNAGNTSLFYSGGAGKLLDLGLFNNTLEGGYAFTFDQHTNTVMVGNAIDGTVLINQGVQIITGNLFSGLVTLQGNSPRTVFVGNGVNGGLANTMTGTTVIANNI